MIERPGLVPSSVRTAATAVASAAAVHVSPSALPARMGSVTPPAGSQPCHRGWVRRVRARAKRGNPIWCNCGSLGSSRSVEPAEQLVGACASSPLGTEEVDHAESWWSAGEWRGFR